MKRVACAELDLKTPEREPLPKRTVDMLALLGEIGAPRALLGALAGMAGGRGLSLDDRRYLEGPIVVHNGGGWDADIPKWMFPQISAERVEIVLGHAARGLIIGPTEVAAVMFAAIMESPLHHDMTQIYLWASTNAAARYYRRPATAIFKEIGMAPITDAEIVTGSLRYEYQGLASEIRRKVVQAQQARERAEKIQTGPKPVEPVVVGIQLDLLRAA